MALSCTITLEYEPLSSVVDTPPPEPVCPALAVCWFECKTVPVGVPDEHVPTLESFQLMSVTRSTELTPEGDKHVLSLTTPCLLLQIETSLVQVLDVSSQ